MSKHKQSPGTRAITKAHERGERIMTRLGEIHGIPLLHEKIDPRTHQKRIYEMNHLNEVLRDQMREHYVEKPKREKEKREGRAPQKVDWNRQDWRRQLQGKPEQPDTMAPGGATGDGINTMGATDYTGADW